MVGLGIGDSLKQCGLGSVVKLQSINLIGHCSQCRVDVIDLAHLSKVIAVGSGHLALEYCDLTLQSVKFHLGNFYCASTSASTEQLTVTVYCD